MGQANFLIEELAEFYQVKGGKAYQAEATARTRGWRVERGELQSPGKGGVRFGWRDICFEGLKFAR